MKRAALPTLSIALLACNALIASPDDFEKIAAAPSGACDGSVCPDADVGPDLDAPWPMLGGNAGHTGAVAFDGTTFPPEKGAVRIYFDGTGESTKAAGEPAIDAEGNAYVVMTNGLFSSYAYDAPNGKLTLRWSKAIGTWARGTPALAGTDRVYVTSDRGLFAFRRSGEEVWNEPVPHGAGSSPVVGRNGRIHVVDDAVHAVAPDGTVRWSYGANEGLEPAAGSKHEAVALDDAGIAYVLRNGVHAIGPSGNRVAHVEVGDPLAPVAVVAEDLVLVGGASRLFARATGSLVPKWDAKLDGTQLLARPAAIPAANIFFLSAKNLSIVDRNGFFEARPAPIDVGVENPPAPVIDGRALAHVATTSSTLEGIHLTVFTAGGAQRGSSRLIDLAAHPVGMAFGPAGAFYITTEAGLVVFPSNR